MKFMRTGPGWHRVQGEQRRLATQRVHCGPQSPTPPHPIACESQQRVARKGRSGLRESKCQSGLRLTAWRCERGRRGRAPVSAVQASFLAAAASPASHRSPYLPASAIGIEEGCAESVDEGCQREQRWGGPPLGSSQALPSASSPRTPPSAAATASPETSSVKQRQCVLRSEEVRRKDSGGRPRRRSTGSKSP